MQQYIGQQRQHPDAVAFGGWSIDLHPSDGVYSTLPSCNQWHGKGLYQIPYRCLYSRYIRNLFLAGRLISVSHMAFGSSRVMATGAYVAQAAAVCNRFNWQPAELLLEGRMRFLERKPAASWQFITGIAPENDGEHRQRHCQAHQGPQRLGRRPCRQHTGIAFRLGGTKIHQYICHQFRYRLRSPHGIRPDDTSGKRHALCGRNSGCSTAMGNSSMSNEANYQTRNVIKFQNTIVTNRISIVAEHPSAESPAAIFEVKAYAG